MGITQREYSLDSSGPLAADGYRLPSAYLWHPALGEAERVRRKRSERERRVVALVTQLRTALLQHLIKIVACREDAEDIIQDACIRLLRVDDLWQTEHHARAFVFKIATNLARDSLRRRKTRRQDAHVSYESVELVHPGLALHEQIDSQRTGASLDRLLRAMPLRHRQVLELHVGDSLSYRAIGARLGVSAKTIERDMSAVRKLLCVLLEGSASGQLG